jgi:hypothetical protein
MSARCLIYSGISAMVLSIIGIVAVIVRVLQATKFNENAGIGAVGGFNVELVMVCGLLFLVGLIVLIIGLIKSFRDKTARMP